MQGTKIEGKIEGKINPNLTPLGEPVRPDVLKSHESGPPTILHSTKLKSENLTVRSIFRRRDLLDG
jgi:hypothetical protein